MGCSSSGLQRLGVGAELCVRQRGKQRSGRMRESRSSAAEVEVDGRGGRSLRALAVWSRGGARRPKVGETEVRPEEGEVGLVAELEAGGKRGYSAAEVEVDGRGGRSLRALAVWSRGGARRPKVGETEVRPEEGEVGLVAELEAGGKRG
nr:unnamed protein product [Digitaria exilis]